MQRTLLALLAIAALAAIGLLASGGVLDHALQDPVAEPAAASGRGAAAAAAAATRGESGPPAGAHDREQAAVTGEPVPAGAARRTQVPAAADADELRIAVRDAAGQPVADVPVGIRVDAAGSRLLWHDVTAGPDATARLQGARARLARAADAGTRLAAILAFPLTGGPEQRLDPDALPQVPVVLTLPPTGAVEIVLDDAAAVPDADLEVELRSPQDLLDGADFVPASRVRPVHGVAKFAWVGLGQRWRAVARRAGQSRDSVHDFDGPQMPGQTVIEHLTVQPQGTVLVVDVRDAYDAPLPNRELHVVMAARRPGSNSTSSFSLRTDPRGVLRLSLQDGLGDGAARELALQAGDLAAKVAVPARLGPGDNDLGVVRLLPPPRICSGTVLGPDGRPVGNASVRVSRRSGDGSQDPWQPLRDVEPVRTGADGRFLVQGEAAPGPLAVAVEADGCLPFGPQPFARGADLQLTLAAAATVTGTVLLGEVIEIQDVVVQLRVGEQVVDERLLRRGSRGAFTFTGQPAGTASVRLRVLGEAGGLLVDGVELRPGEVTADPRLQDVDLAAGRRVVHFEVVGPDGLPADGARAVVVPADPRATAFEGQILDHGVGRIVTERASLSLLVFGADRRTVRVDGVVDGQVISLPAALRVRLRLPAGCRVPDPSFHLEASLRPRDDKAVNGSYVLWHGLSSSESGDGSLPWRAVPGAPCGADGDAVLRVPVAGAYVAHWRLEHGGRVAIVGGDQDVTVGDDAFEQVLPAGITQADVDRALASVR